MCDKMIVVARIEQLSTQLDLGHQDSARVALYSESMDKGSFLLSILETRVFLSK